MFRTVEPAGDLLYMAGLGEEMQPPYCSTLAVGRMHAYPHPARTGTAQERLDHETAKVGVVGLVGALVDHSVRFSATSKYAVKAATRRRAAKWPAAVAAGC
jgi:hypothetical protein